MNYMVFDLEFNQVFSFNREHPRLSNPRCPFEIINIGAVKLNNNLEETGTFDRLVKPVLYTRIHPYVKKMTGIAREGLKHAEPFITVYRELAKFMDGVDVLCVFGTSDIKELLRNIEFHKMDKSPIPQKYIDVQHYISHHLKRPKGSSISLGDAAEAMNIPIRLEFHNAFNDAFYTAEIFKKIFNKQIKPEIFHLHREKEEDKRETGRTAFDSIRLISQFEKMYHRKMTDEEQSIIKFAYKMGSSNQFQK